MTVDGSENGVRVIDMGSMIKLLNLCPETELPLRSLYLKSPLFPDR